MRQVYLLVLRSSFASTIIPLSSVTTAIFTITYHTRSSFIYLQKLYHLHRLHTCLILRLERSVVSYYMTLSQIYAKWPQKKNSEKSYSIIPYPLDEAELVTSAMRIFSSNYYFSAFCRFCIFFSSRGGLP
jgi:hypothetical protein